MAPAAVHCIKDFRPSRSDLRTEDSPVNLPDKHAKLLALANSYFDIEGSIDGLSCMAQLAVDNAASFDFQRATAREQNQLLFTIYHLHELITNLRGKYYERFEK